MQEPLLQIDQVLRQVGDRRGRLIYFWGDRQTKKVKWTATKMVLNIGTYQVDPLGSWFGSNAAHAFIVANGAAKMS